MIEVTLSTEERLNNALKVLKDWVQAADELELRGKVAMRVGDKMRAEGAQKELENALKTIEELKKEVNQLEAEATKNTIN